MDKKTIACVVTALMTSAYIGCKSYNAEKDITHQESSSLLFGVLDWKMETDTLQKYSDTKQIEKLMDSRLVYSGTFSVNGKEYFCAVTDICSGVSCPQFYIFKKGTDSSWTEIGSAMSSGAIPRNITIDYLNKRVTFITKEQIVLGYLSFDLL